MSDRLLAWTPWAVLLSLILGTLFVWRGVEARSEADRRRHFDGLVHRVAESIQHRVALSRLSGLGTSGLFDASEEVRRDEFQTYVETLSHTGWPEQIGLGYVEVVPREKLDEFVRASRLEGAEGYEVVPKGDRDFYYLIRFAEPAAFAERTLGFDVASQPHVRPLYEQARDTGELIMSGALDLIEDSTDEPGFLVVAPVYTPGPRPRTVQERRLRCHGWIYIAVTEASLHTVLEKILHESRDQLDVSIYAGSELTEDNRLYGSAWVPSTGRLTLEDTRTIDLPGISWTLRMRTAPLWIFADPEDDPTLVLSTGLALSLALFSVLYSLVRTRTRAMTLARGMTVDLRRHAAELEKRSEELARSREATAKAGEALMAQQATLARADRLAAVGEVAAGLAHELRNPLAGIQMTLENLRREAKDPDHADRLERVIGEVDRLSRLLSQHLEAARYTPEPLQPVALLELVRDLIDVVGPALPERIVLECDVAPGLACELPRDRVRQVLLNLVLNAVQAIGERPGRVWIDAKRSEDRLALSVSDDGPGFPDDMLNKPIGPFVSRREGGTGLGLATVRRLAADLEGSVRLENRKEGGATVVLDLPFIEG